MSSSDQPQRAQATKFLVISFAVIFALISLYGAFVEYRHIYYGNGIDYELCNYSLIRNCILLEADTARYVAAAQVFTFDKIVDLIQNQSVVSLGVLNNILLYFDFDFAKFLAPDSPYIVIAFVNALLFLGGALNYQVIARKLEIDERSVLIVYLLNPLMLFAMSSLNKEIFGIYVVSGLARAYLNRRIAILLLFIVLAFLTRFAFGALGMILLTRYAFPSFRAKHILLFLGLAIPLVFVLLEGHLGGSAAPSLYEYAQSIDQQSTAVMAFAAQMMAYPFGPYLGWALVGSVNVISPIANFSLYARYMDGFNIDIFVEQCSSFLFALFGSITFWRIAARRFVLLPIAEMFLYFFIIVSTFPISAHRYLTAGWPLLAIGCLEYGVLMRSEIRSRPNGGNITKVAG